VMLQHFTNYIESQDLFKNEKGLAVLILLSISWLGRLSDRISPKQFAKHLVFDTDAMD
jgi:hypothetical protein